MKHSQLYWLPESADFNASLGNIKKNDMTLRERFTKLQRIAGTRLDFVQTNKVDRLLIQNFEESVVEKIERPSIKLAMLSSSTVDHLLPSIRVSGLRRGIIIDCYLGPYGQLFQEIMDQDSGLHRFAPDVVLLCIDGRSAVAEIELSATITEVEEVVAKRVKELQQMWNHARASLGAVIIQQTVIDHGIPVFGNYDLHVPASPTSIIRLLNRALTNSAVADGILLLDAEWWAAELGRRQITDLKLWHQAKQEISPSESPFFGDLIARQLAAIRGLSRP